jgi:hypothetical protein
MADLFHGLRKVGNAASHDLHGDAREALHQLRVARELGVWFHRAFGNVGTIVEKRGVSIAVPTVAESVQG